jgi:tripartite-type tricarboxylate transporter receptor subunit TctC
MPHLRLFRHALAVLAISSLVLASERTVAQTYPSSKITLIVAFAAGGVVDTLARAVGSINERLHQNVVVENWRRGAENIAAGVVVNAAPDGYTPLVTTTAPAINEMLRD